MRVACRDDRGALSDTVTQYIPLRNFPPVINFQADFDTVRWSYGAANFRLFALDLDGNETLDDSLLYRLDTADTTIVRAIGSPGADPALCWVKKAFDDPLGRTFSIALKGTPPAAARTLTVSVRDEARSDARLHWTWKVLEARGPVLLVADAGPSSLHRFLSARSWTRCSARGSGRSTTSAARSSIGRSPACLPSCTTWGCRTGRGCCSNRCGSSRSCCGTPAGARRSI